MTIDSEFDCPELEDIIHPINHLKVFTFSLHLGLILCEANFIDFRLKRCYFRAFGEDYNLAQHNCIARILTFYNE